MTTLLIITLIIIVVIININWKYFSAENKEIRKNNKETKRKYREDERNRKIQEENERQEELLLRKKRYIEQQEREKQSRFDMYKALRQKTEQMPIYKRWRNEVLTRCNNRCQMCGINNNLEVHHRNSFYSILKRNNISNIEQAFECKELWDINNGEVLCVECHEKMESSKKMKELNQ